MKPIRTRIVKKRVKQRDPLIPRVFLPIPEESFELPDQDYGLCCLPYIIDVLYALVDQVEPETASLALRYASDLAVSIESMLSTYSHEKLESELQHLGYHLSVGLVWTVFRGEVQFVEAMSMAGKGDLHLTGQLGDVNKESAQIALTWVRSRATELKFAATKEINLLEGRDVHIHFPAGAIPKDGPSTGVALLTAPVLLFSQIKVRSDTTMTREMTLQGLVLPVGGIKDKIVESQDWPEITKYAVWFVPKPIDRRSSSRICTKAGRIQTWEGLKYTVGR
ncbi:hypothetical protein AgCh_012705 [Apium graveolens]